MDNLKFYNSIELENTSLVEIIKSINEFPNTIILNNTFENLYENTNSMFKVETEYVIIEELFKEFPKANFITESFNLYGIGPTIIHLL